MNSDKIFIEYIPEDNLEGISGGGDFVFLSLNVRSLRNKFSLFELFLNSLHDLGVVVDVIMLTETFLSRDESEFYNIEGFNSFHLTRQNRSGGGMAFFIKNCHKVNHKVTKLHVREVELMIIKLDDLNLSVCGVYRPTGNEKKAKSS